MRSIFIILTVGFIGMNSVGTAETTEALHLRWQKIVATRVNSAIWVGFMSAENPDRFNGIKRTAESLGIPAPKLSAWRSGKANITVEEGLRAASALNAAPWFLLGWDVLSQAYWNDVIDYEDHQMKPEVLNGIRSPIFREMVRTARANWRFDVIRPGGHVFEPALCEANLLTTNMIRFLESKGFKVVPPKQGE